VSRRVRAGDSADRDTPEDASAVTARPKIVRFQLGVGRRQGEAFELRLRDRQTVKGIAVVAGKARNLNCMPDLDGERRHSRRGHP